MASPTKRAFEYLLVLAAFAMAAPATAQQSAGWEETTVLSPWAAQAHQALGPSTSPATIRRMGAQEWIVWTHDADEQYLPKCHWSRGVKRVVVISRFDSIEGAQADTRHQIGYTATRRHSIQVDMRGLAGVAEGLYIESHDQQQPCGLWGERISEFRVGNFNVNVWEVPSSRPLPDLGFVERLIALTSELARGYPPGSGTPAGPALGPQPGQPIVTIVASNPAQNFLEFKIEPVQPAPRAIVPGQFSQDLGPATAAALRRLEDMAFMHPSYVGPEGEPVMAVSPYITDGVIGAAEAGARVSMAAAERGVNVGMTAAETSARLGVAAAEAGANWVKNNPEKAAGLAVATAVSIFVPAAPIAAYVLGASSEAMVIGGATEVVIGGMISSGTEAFVTTTLKEISTDRSLGDKLLKVAGATGGSALTSIPGSLMGSNVTAIMGQFVAQKTAGVVGAAAGKGVDMAVDALGVGDAAQQALTGQLPPEGATMKSGGVIIATSLSPQPGTR